MLALMEGMVDVLARMVPIVVRPEFDFLRPDPNPFPRIRLFRKASR